MKIDRIDFDSKGNAIESNPDKIIENVRDYYSSKDEIEKENTPIREEDSKNEAENKILLKNKKYQYHRLQLTLIGENGALLDRLCEYFGIPKDRVYEQHDAGVVWELLTILEPLLDARAQKKEEIRADIKRHKLSKEDLF